MIEYWLLPSLITLLVILRVSRVVDGMKPADVPWGFVAMIAAAWPFGAFLAAYLLAPKVWAALAKGRCLRRHWERTYGGRGRRCQVCGRDCLGLNPSESVKKKWVDI